MLFQMFQVTSLDPGVLPKRAEEAWTELCRWENSLFSGFSDVLMGMLVIIIIFFLQ